MPRVGEIGRDRLGWTNEVCWVEVRGRSSRYSDPRLRGPPRAGKPGLVSFCLSLPQGNSWLQIGYRENVRDSTLSRLCELYLTGHKDPASGMKSLAR